MLVVLPEITVMDREQALLGVISGTKQLWDKKINLGAAWERDYCLTTCSFPVLHSCFSGLGMRLPSHHVLIPSPPLLLQWPGNETTISPRAHSQSSTPASSTCHHISPLVLKTTAGGWWDKTVCYKATVSPHA